MNTESELKLKKTIYFVLFLVLSSSLTVFVILRSSRRNQDKPRSPDDILTRVLAEPISGLQSMRPGWTVVDYPEEYRENGRELVFRLIEYLKVKQEGDDSKQREKFEPTKRDAVLMLTAQLASDLKVKKAIPFLVQELEKIVPDDDTFLGSCLVAKLVELTEIETGYGFHRRWFDKEVQANAVKFFKTWVKENGF